MSFAFPFFSSKRPAEPAQASKEADFTPPLQEAGVADECFLPTPFPKNPFLDALPTEAGDFTLLPVAKTEEDWENMPTLLLPSPQPPAHTPLPEKRNTPRGLAALVVNQSEQETPPLNRRPTSPFPAHSIPPPLPPQAPPLNQAEMPVPAAHSLPTIEADHLKEELHQEIEQVKNDLFGAVMGVSALKDRLDGLESQLSNLQAKPPAPAPTSPAPNITQAQISEWMTTWVAEHLPAALERALSTAQERNLSAMSSPAYFRSTDLFSDAERQSFLNLPPVVLSSTPV